MEDMNFYNKHYIAVDAENRIVDGFSDAFREPTEEHICINERGGYQFRLTPNGEENPTLYDWDGRIPLYRWDGAEVIHRTEEEVEKERTLLSLPTAEEVRAQRARMLAETDWTQVADAPIDTATRTAMRVYRQQLRDITEQAGFPTDIVWPEMPTIVNATPEPIDEVVEAIIGVEVTA